MKKIITRAEARKLGLKHYFTGEPCKNGHLSKRYTSCTNCFACGEESKKTNPYLVKYSKKWKAKKRKQNPLYQAIAGAKHRAAKAGLEWDLPGTMDIPTHCPCCGRQISIDNTKLQNDSPSIDRLDSNKGYTLDNINIICWRCNSLKKDATASELRQLADWMDSVRAFL